MQQSALGVTLESISHRPLVMSRRAVAPGRQQSIPNSLQINNNNSRVAYLLLERRSIDTASSRHCHIDNMMAKSIMQLDMDELNNGCGITCLNSSSRRRRCKRIQRCSVGSQTILQSTALPLTLLLLTTLLDQANAGLSFGGATSTDACYSALENAQRPNPTDPTENVVDKNGYVAFIQEMSDDAFTSLQKNDAGEWGMFPTTDFDGLPTNIKGEFWTRACGGPNTICSTAWLVTDGVDGSQVDAQQTVTLFQVCKGVENAIKDATRPKPTPKPVVVTPPPVGVVVTPTPPSNLPQCTPLYEAGTSYDPGTLVSNQKLPSTAANGAPQAYSNYQCIVSDGRCSQAEYEPGKEGSSWTDVWNVIGDCNLEISQTAPTTSPPTTSGLPSCPPLYEIGVEYKPGSVIANSLPLILTNGQPTYYSYECKPLPEGNWCQQPAYEPGKNDDIWKQAWDVLERCVVQRPSFPDPPTYSPTGPPPPTTQPIEETSDLYNGDLVVKLVYHAVVGENVTTEELQDVDHPVTSSLILATTTWSFKTRDEHAQAQAQLQEEKSNRRRANMRRRQMMSQTSTLLRGGTRELVVNPVPAMQSVLEDPSSMEIIDVECSTNLNSTTDHCIQVTTNLTLKLINEPIDSVENTRLFFELEFGRDLQNGEFYDMIARTNDAVKAVYPVPGPKLDENAPTENGSDAPPGEPAAPPVPNPSTDLSGLDRLIIEDDSQGKDDGGGAPIAGIVSGVVVGLVVVVAIGFFVYRRRHNAKYADGASYDSHKKRDFDPTNDLEGGEASEGDSSQYSEFSSSGSQSSASMASYSGSESRSSQSSRSSSSSYTSRSGSGSGYSKGSSGSSSSGSKGPGQAAAASVSASESDSYSSGNVSGGQRANPPPLAARDTAGGMDRGVSHGSEASSRSGASGSLYSHHDDGSSVGDASDPGKNMMAGDGGSRGSSSHGSRSSASHSRANSRSHHSRSHSSSHSSEGYQANVDLMDSDQHVGSKGTNATPTDDDSSAGSSGWDSSDGESTSVDTGSVDSYDPNTIKTGDFSASGTSYPTNSSSDEYDGMDQDPLEAMMNPAVNPVVQRGVTMLPIAEQPDEDMSSAIASQSTMDTLDNLGRGGGGDQPPLGVDIQDAIEKGDWAAVGATAAILASNSGSGEDSSASGDEGGYDSRSGRDSSSSTKRGSDGMTMSLASSAKSDEDDMRAAEIDALVETGNWDGVVAVAARYADEADEADQSLGRPVRRNRESSQSPPTNDELSNSRTTESGQNDSFVKSTGSAGSVSIERADDTTSVYSNTTRDSYSHTTHSVEDSFVSDSGSTMSGTNSTPPDTQSSSITSSYISRDNVTSSMVSAVSTVDPQEKRQMNAYRAEVEALVRRVVPDEIDNVDDIMVQFSGREEELIETLRAMQEKSIAQRARAAVQRSAKKEAGARSGRDAMDDDSTHDGDETYSTQEDGGQSYTTGSYTTNSRSTNSRTTHSSYANQTHDSESESESSQTGEKSSRRGSITEQFTEEGDDDEYSSGSRSSSRSSTSGSGTMSSYTSVSDSRASSVSGSMYSRSIMSEHGDEISEAIDASDWRAVGEAAAHLQKDGVSSEITGMTIDKREDKLDDMIDTGDWSGIIDAATNMRGGNAVSGGGGNAEDLD